MGWVCMFVIKEPKLRDVDLRKVYRFDSFYKHFSNWTIEYVFHVFEGRVSLCFAQICGSSGL